MIKLAGTLWEGHLPNFAGNTVDTYLLDLPGSRQAIFLKLLLLFIFVHFSYWLSCAACWNLVPQPGNEPTTSAVNRVLTTGPPGNSLNKPFLKKHLQPDSCQFCLN